MNQSHLTLKYRPQNFSQVLGQEAVRSILSRAAAEDAIAPAYLFSGTRGVGKTTLARILAKAINCVEAPTGEPCNRCDHCRQITRGSGVDVVEIDGASNTGVEHVRRLKEDVGYAPIECRYKVIIIDEAHMLSKAAFNALLKTLEEPPGHVTFIMATTEPQRFPATIISRCQHYVFKRLSQKELESHLRSILEHEEVEFEPAAVSLLARRGSGSVRDSLSLMAQVLAMGTDVLKEEDVRLVLGLTGHETLFELFQAFADRDCLAVNTILRQILDQGLDLGFFLRELTMAWRNLFLLRQTGRKGLPLLEVPEEDAEQWLAWAEVFPSAQVHACWQLTLEGQRRVLTSVEPALALELLLLNLAFLPELMPLGKTAVSGAGGGGGGVQKASPGKANLQTPRATPSKRAGDDAVTTTQESAPEYFASDRPKASQPERPKSWSGFVEFCLTNTQSDSPRLSLQQVKGEVKEGVLELTCANPFHCQRLEDKEKNSHLKAMVGEYFGPDMDISIQSAAPHKKENGNWDEIRNKTLEHPLVKSAVEQLGAQPIVRPKNGR